MMKKTTILILLTACSTLFADLDSVVVPATMLHKPNPSMGLGCMGKVEYSLTPRENDSIIVSLSIIPSGGGTPLTLAEVSGDVGLIAVNTNKSNSTKTYSIFFQALNVQPNVKYKARITADAYVSEAKKHCENLISTMTKSQKAALMTARDQMSNCGAGSVPPTFMADGPHGVRDNKGGNATLFATCAGLNATWDTALAYMQGQAKGEEFRGYKYNCELGPANNIVYHPLGGRASEYYGEDPYLNGHMMAADVRGIQSRQVIATIKHFACNNIEKERWGMSAVMSERSLQEIYLYNWKPSVVGTQGCWGVMNAYNSVSTPEKQFSSTNKYLLTTVLREEWGYKYLVMTDWGAGFNSTKQGVEWGTDIQMTGNDFYNVSVLTGYSDSLINMHARRIILAHENLGDMKPGYDISGKYTPKLNGIEHGKVSRIVGDAGIVLAKNTGDILPIPKTGKKVALIGPYANVFRNGPAGSSAYSPLNSAKIDPVTGITRYLNGLPAGHSNATHYSNPSSSQLNEADYIVVFVGVSGETEAHDRPSLSVTGESDNSVSAALAATNGPNKTIVVFTGGSAASPGKWSTAQAILIAFYPGQDQGYSMADVLFGDVNPSGRLAVTFPSNSSQLPNFSQTSDLRLIYPSSDSAHGYFRMNKRGETPLFWFGHGLSYTTFSYSELQVYPENIKPGDRVLVKVKVTNTGKIEGKTVVQLYLSMPQNVSGMPTRVQDLRGFQKVSLAAGESKTVNFQLTADEMQVWKPNGGDYSGNGFWTVLPGSYTVRIGASADITAQPTIDKKFTVQ